MSDRVGEDEQEKLRQRVRAVLDGPPAVSQSAAAKEAEIAYATFSAWLNGKYAGDNGRVGQDVVKWLDARAAKKQTAATVAALPVFQVTATAREFIAAIQYAHITTDILVMVGAPGVGKTESLKHYRDTTPNVWLCTMEPTTARPSLMLGEICATLDIGEKSAAKLSRAIGKFVSGKNGLIIVDEAQHLSTEAIDQLRSLNDRYGVALVLAGNEAIVARLEGAKASFGQLYSRVGVRLRRRGPRPEDLSVLIAAWGVIDPDEIRLLTAIGRKPGALRTLNKVMRLASTLAAGAGEARSLATIKTAWERLAPDTGGAE